jgi:hypothetical protein
MSKQWFCTIHGIELKSKFDICPKCMARAAVNPSFDPPVSPDPSVHPLLPTDAKVRKNAPLARGVLDYFPRALAAVAELSRIGNEQHNPGQPMHWDKTKSTDHADCMLRHLIERGIVDTDGVLHSTKVAWRALAALEIELEGKKDK